MSMRDNVLQIALQNALNRANPSGLPSNLVIQQFGSSNDTVGMPDSVAATVSPLSAMTWGNAKWDMAQWQ